jgi:hypothetical protein
MTALGQALLTVLIGVATFATGQIVVKLFDPIFELRSLFGEIARNLLLYENRDDRVAEPQKRLLIFRSLAAVLHEKVQKVVWYPLFSLFRIVPPKDDARTASMLLLSLSNCQVAKPEEIGPIYRPAFGNLVGMFLIPSRLSNECGRLFSTILDL